MAAGQKSAMLEPELDLVTPTRPQKPLALGKSNAAGRLDDFVQALSNLSVDELCALKNAVDGKVSKKVDFLSRLPDELRIAILQCLAPEDVWPCLRVSAKWRAFLLDAQFMTLICRDVFPGLLEMAAFVAEESRLRRNAGVDQVHMVPSPAMVGARRQMQAFKEACLYCFLRHYKVKAAPVFFQRPWLHDSVADAPSTGPVSLLDPTVAEDEQTGEIFRAGKLGSCPHELAPRIADHTSFSGESLYSSGRLVWRPSSIHNSTTRFFVVDDFSTRTRRTLEVPRIYGDLGSRLGLFCVGDSLVIARDVTHRRLAVWNLSGDPWFSLARLPRRVDQAATAGGVVVGTYRENTEDGRGNGGGDGHSEIGMLMWRWTRDGRGRVVERTLAEPTDYAAELVELRQDCVRHVHSLLIHPADEAIVYLFVASLHPAKETVAGEPYAKATTIAVFEVTGHRISARWKMDIPVSWLDENYDASSDVGFKPIDRHGSYFTASRRRDGPRAGTLHHEYVVFNIYTKKLTMLYSVVPKRSTVSYGKELLWDGRCITWQKPLQEPTTSPCHLLPLVVTPTFARDQLPVLSPRSLSSVPCPSLPFCCGREGCRRSVAPAEGCESCQKGPANVKYDSHCVEVKPRAVMLDNFIARPPISTASRDVSLHEALAALAPQLDLSESRPPSRAEWELLRTRSINLKEAYANMEACHLDSAINYGAAFHALSLREELGHENGNVVPLIVSVQPSPRVVRELPIMWTDDRYMVFLSQAGYTVWEFRGAGAESEL